jgi:hypothetical protein
MPWHLIPFAMIALGIAISTAGAFLRAEGPSMLSTEVKQRFILDRHDHRDPRSLLTKFCEFYRLVRASDCTKSGADTLTFEWGAQQEADEPVFRAVLGGRSPQTSVTTRALNFSWCTRAR